MGDSSTSVRRVRPQILEQKVWQKDPCGSFCPAAQQLCRHYCTLNIDTANKTDCPSKWLRHVQALLASVSQAQLIADVGVPQVRG